VLSLLLAAVLAAPPVDPCPGRPTSIVVEVLPHLLWLCERGEGEGPFPVAIGWGGTPKQMEGDGKTPVGVYPLGDPEPSGEYLWTIPIGYPTEEQRRAGMSGGRIAIHGAPRPFHWLGKITTWFDWTGGGVALGRDADLETVVAWVRAHGLAPVEIR
jgi:hypothetical protein